MPKSADQLSIEQAMKLCSLGAVNKRSPHTIRNYGNGMRVFREFLTKYDPPLPSPNSMLSEIEMDHFIYFPSWMTGTGKYSHATIMVYISGAKYFLDWLILNDYIDPTPKEMLRYKMSIEDITRKRGSHKPRTPKEGTAELVRKAVYEMQIKPARSDSDFDVRQKELERLRNIALVELLYSSGCRNFEAAGLNVEHFDLDNRRAEIIAKGTGGARSEIIYFSSECVDALKAYWKERYISDKTAPAFIRHDRAVTRFKKPVAITTRTVHKVVVTCAVFAGLERKDFHPHSFRHAFVKRILLETGNLALAQDLARHKSTDTTREYTVLEEKEKMEAHHQIFK